MFMDYIAPSPELDSLADLHAQDARHFRAMFLGLADLGVEIAQVVAQRVKDEAYAPASAPTQLPALVDAYDTMLRALRRTALLVQKLTSPAPVPGHARPGGRRGGDLVDRDAPVDFSKLSDAELDRLDELDRLEGLEPEDELAGRPLRAVVAAILKDFGVATPGWDGAMCGLAAENAAPTGDAARPAGPVMKPHGAAGTGSAAGGGEPGAIRLNGATGCRDP
jgi:hypothetical protein